MVISYSRILLLQEHIYESAAGIVCVSKDGQRVLVVRPTNGYGGYEFTFPKGRINKNENSQDAAKREFEEETGIPKNNLKNLKSIGKFKGTTTNTEYFVASMSDESVVDSAQPPVNPELGFPEAEKVEWMWIEDALDNTQSNRDRTILRILSKGVQKI